MQNKTKIIILAIESSCDETAASVCINGEICSNIIATQEIHQQYGGVIPELASRAHLQNIDVVVKATLQQANVTMQQLSAVAYTNAPGLMGALIVGSGFAKSMSLALQIPLIEVHHMQAHVLANLIPQNNNALPKFPFLCLTVSGGHTQIVQCNTPLQMQVLGQTLDDAAGEAFDKSAKILGLPYPGGPLIDKYAQFGNAFKYKFTEPQISELNFSFSGLKTGILYFIQKEVAQNENFIQENLNDICASIQQRIISILLNKLKKAIQLTGIKELCIAGGVSANTGLRKAFFELGKKMNCNTYIPDFSYCTDNAAMIAITAYYKFLNNEFANLASTPTARANF